MKSIGIVSCARSDYGIYLPILKRIKSHPLHLQIYATGMHLSPEFGRTVEVFGRDGFEVHEKVEMLLSSDTPEGIAKSMGMGVIGFSQVFSRNQPDILLLMGDRFEMFSAAIAALPYKIPIAHIHGGETTEGAIDELIRHSITKLSHLHFPAADAYAQRLRQMGEEEWRITVVGAPGLDNIAEIPLLSRDETAQIFDYDPTEPVLLSTFHSVTMEYENTKDHIVNLISALSEIGTQVLFTYPNADTAGRIIIEQIEKFCREHSKARVVVNAGQQQYLSLLNSVDGMVGNSSSGIIEAASFKLPVVNIGSRQRGRIHSHNVVNCGYSVPDITSALQKILSRHFRESLHDLVNPYGDGKSSERIVRVLADVKIDQRMLVKKFRDLAA